MTEQTEQIAFLNPTIAKRYFEITDARLVIIGQGSYAYLASDFEHEAAGWEYLATLMELDHTKYHYYKRTRGPYLEIRRRLVEDWEMGDSPKDA